jgi:membrane protein
MKPTRLTYGLLTVVALAFRRRFLPEPPAAPTATATDTPTAPPAPAHTPAPVERRGTPPPQSPPRGIVAKFRLVPKAVKRFIGDDCTTMSAAIAYYTTFSLAPLLLIVISIVGLIFGREAVQHEIQGQIEGLIGRGAGGQIGAMVQNAGQHSSTGVLSAILGGLALLFGASGAFTQLQSSLNKVWRVEPDPKAGGVKTFAGQRLLSLGMILAIAFLLIVSLAVSAGLSAFGNYVSSFLPKALSGPVLQALTSLVSLAIIAALFAAMFKVLPDARIGWRDVWIGGALTSVLFTIGKFLIGLYLGHSGTASAYGAAGSFVLIVLWIYYSSMILLFGAEFTEVWSETYSGAAQPKKGAVRMDEKSVPPSKAA